MDYTFAVTGVGAGRFAQMYDNTNNRSFYDGINIQRKRTSKHIMFQASDVVSWSRAWSGFQVASNGGAPFLFHAASGESRCTAFTLYPALASCFFTSSAIITERCLPPVHPNAMVR